MLLVGFSFTFVRDSTSLPGALPTIISFWIVWALGVAWVRSRCHPRQHHDRGEEG